MEVRCIHIDLAIFIGGCAHRGTVPIGRLDVQCANHHSKVALHTSPQRRSTKERDIPGTSLVCASLVEASRSNMLLDAGMDTVPTSREHSRRTHPSPAGAIRVGRSLTYETHMSPLNRRDCFHSCALQNSSNALFAAAPGALQVTCLMICRADRHIMIKRLPRFMCTTRLHVPGQQ